ncbi:MAG: hypothetical protein ACO2OY_00310 [Thermodesulfobacteriaceae bacterium]|jgi:hypothetical protein
MIKNKKLLERFEKELIKKEKINIEKNFRIFEEMIKFAKDINRFSQKDWKKDIENDIRYARAINGIKKTNRKNCKRI